MDDPEILKYFRAERTIKIEPGSDIREFLEESDLLAILKSGEVEFESAGGQTRVSLKPGTPLGILKNDSVEGRANVTAIGSCELVPLDEDDVAKLVEFNPRFAHDLIGVMVATVNDLVRLLP